MQLFWDNRGAHMLHIRETDNWHLFCELDDYEDAVINLDLNGQANQLCSSSKYTQGREHLGLTSDHVLEYYSAVIRFIFNQVNSKDVTQLDLTEIENAVIPSFWAAWKDAGLVDHDHW